MEGTPITTPPVIKAAPEDEAITIVDESAPEIVKLATDGDVILVVPRADRQSVEKSFLVSSHVLAQASTYFKERFQTDTREGWSIKAGNCPRIILEEKSAKAVEVILYKLHFVNSANHNRVTASTLMEIAKYCYKYHSNAALSSWMRHWFLSLPKTASVKGHPFLIVAAHYAENKDLLQAISARVSFWITRSEWQAFKGNFPDADLVLPSELMERAFKIGDDVSFKVQTLLQESDQLVMEGHRCSELSVEGQHVEYFSILRAAHIWPTIKYFRKRSLLTIACDLQKIVNQPVHSCSRPNACPLTRELKSLAKQTWEILDKEQNVWPGLPSMKTYCT